MDLSRHWLVRPEPSVRSTGSVAELASANRLGFGPTTTLYSLPMLISTRFDRYPLATAASPHLPVLLRTSQDPRTVRGLWPGFVHQQEFGAMEAIFTFATA